jgi:hypothetical protein
MRTTYILLALPNPQYKSRLTRIDSPGILRQLMVLPLGFCKIKRSKVGLSDCNSWQVSSLRLPSVSISVWYTPNDSTCHCLILIWLGVAITFPSLQIFLTILTPNGVRSYPTFNLCPFAERAVLHNPKKPDNLAKQVITAAPPSHCLHHGCPFRPAQYRKCCTRLDPSKIEQISCSQIFLPCVIT